MDRILLYSIGALIGVVVSPIGFISLLVGLRTGWQVGLRIFALVGLPIATAVVVGSLIWDRLPDTAKEPSITGTALGLLLIPAWYLVRFLINTRAAGAYLVGQTNTQIQSGLGLGLLALLIWSMAMITTTNLARGPIGFIVLGYATFLIIQGTTAFQLREKGIVSRGSFWPWNDIASASWVNVSRRDKLKLTLKSAHKSIELKIPDEQRDATNDMLQIRFLRLQK